MRLFRHLLNEIWVEFTLTRQQVELEPDLRTARTLAIRAANTLAQAEDALIFQGDASLPSRPLFLQNQVQYRSGPAGSGLLNASFPEAQELFVPALETDQTRYGEQTFEAVSDGYQRLQARGHHGPYALVLHPTPYADTHAALPTTLLMPASRIRRLLKTTFYGTNTLPAMTGLLLSVGGSTMELVMGRELMATFMFEDPNGKFRFRVWERFALRLRDQSAVMRLNFQTG